MQAGFSIRKKQLPLSTQISEHRQLNFDIISHTYNAGSYFLLRFFLLEDL